jgi:hypothetical protein
MHHEDAAGEERLPKAFKEGPGAAHKRKDPSDPDAVGPDLREAFVVQIEFMHGHLRAVSAGAVGRKGVEEAA